MGRGSGRGGRGRGRGPSPGGRGFGRGRSGGRGAARRGYQSDPGSGGEGLGEFVSLSWGAKPRGHKARVKQRARRARQRQEDDDSWDSDDSEGDGTGTARAGLSIGGLRVYEDRGGGARVVPAAGARAGGARGARARAALDASSSSDSALSDDSDMSDATGSSGSSDWEGELLEADDAALADYAANAGAEAHALIAAMALGGEGKRRAPRHLRAVLDQDGDSGSEDDSGSDDEEEDDDDDASDEGEEEEEEDEEEGATRQLGGSAPAAGWQWHNGGRTMRRGEPGQAAASKSSRKTHKRPAPGEKAAKRKAAITHKRADRAAGRGFDAASVAEAMRGFIAAGGDMMALRPAGKFELRVTAALAALHGLRCSVQGSGKKRFAVLRSTPHASPPPPGDARLAALLRGVGSERPERAERRSEPREPREPRSGGRPPKSTPQSGSARRAQRMAFVSGGRIGGDDDGEVRPALTEGDGMALEASFVAVQAGLDASVVEAVTVAIATPAPAQNRGLRRAAEAAAREAAKLARRRGSSGGPRSRHRADADDEPAAPRSAPHGDFGDFERHTTGFGSRMLVKMGFAGAGSGLGRDGAGRAEPILPAMRGKGVGLGAD